MLGLGIDIGGTNTKIIVADDRGALVKTERFATQPELGPSDFAKRLAASVSSIRNSGMKIDSIGIGAAGDVDPEKGVIRYSPNLNWRNVRLTQPVEKLTGLPCVMENDANMAAWGAFIIELKGHRCDALVITLGTGIGSGIIINGELYHGATGTAGEAGHIIIEPEGRVCNCGARGCLEAYCGSLAIMKRASELIKDRGAFVEKYYKGGAFNTIALTKAAEAGNAEAVKIWEETGTYLGRGLVNLVLVLNPDYILLTGGVSNAKKWFMPYVREVMKNQAIATPFSRVKIKASDNPELGSLGAALFGLSRAGLKP